MKLLTVLARIISFLSFRRHIGKYLVISGKRAASGTARSWHYPGALCNVIVSFFKPSLVNVPDSFLYMWISEEEKELASESIGHTNQKLIFEMMDIACLHMELKYRELSDGSSLKAPIRSYLLIHHCLDDHKRWAFSQRLRGRNPSSFNYKLFTEYLNLKQ